MISSTVTPSRGLRGKDVYKRQILMSLMMLSMVFVMITMSMESAERICEVLNEQSNLTSPDNAVTEVKDGSVDFDNVSFCLLYTSKISTILSGATKISSAS